MKCPIDYLPKDNRKGRIFSAIRFYLKPIPVMSFDFRKMAYLSAIILLDKGMLLELVLYSKQK